MLTFEDIALSHQGKYLEFLRRSGTKASDYSFINLWGWASEDGISLAWDDDLVWIRQSAPSPCLWAPIGPWEIIDWQAVFNRMETSALAFTRIPEELLKLWDSALPGRVHAEDSREHWDYLYSVPELVELKGNRFHKKKNLLNQFKKKHPYRYQRIEPDLIQRVLDMQEDWCAWRDCESIEVLASENRVIRRVLNAWEQLIGIRGSALFIDERLVAFTVAEGLSGQTLLVHFEKGLTGYIGVYQAINQMFLEDTEGYTLVNREPDLGDEGLRAAKFSYNPTGYIKKFEVKIS